MKVLKTVLASAALMMVSLSVSAQDYNRITLGYTPMKWTASYQGQTETSETVDGLTLNYTHGFGISESAPLFVEVGAGLKYNMTDDWSEFNGTKIDEETTKFLSLVVPANLTYRIPVSGKFSIAPYGGLHLKYNILAKAKAELAGVTVVDENLFDEGYKHFQVGYQAGVNFNISHFMVGAGYQGDITNLADHVHSHGFVVNVGYEF